MSKPKPFSASAIYDAGIRTGATASHHSKGGPVNGPSQEPLGGVAHLPSGAKLEHPTPRRPTEYQPGQVSPFQPK